MSWWPPKTTNITNKPPHPKRGLTPDQVRDVRTSTETLSLLGKRHGVSAVAVYNCKRRLTYKDLP